METRSLPSRVSPSAIDVYRSCPRRFLWQYVERRPIERLPSPELILGNAIHRTLELLFLLRPEDRSVEAAHQLLRSVWPEFRERRAFSSLEHEAAIGRAGLEMLGRFSGRFDLRGQPVKLEQRLEITVAASGRRGIRVVTRVDRVDPGSAGRLRLIDYKTGKRRIDDGRELAEDTAALVHLVAVEKLSGRKVEALSHVYLTTGEEITWSPEPEDAGEATKRLGRLVLEISSDQTFEPLPGALCGWCPFALQCDASPSVELADFAPVENLPF